MKETTDQAMQDDFEASGAIYPKVEASQVEALMQKVLFDVHVCEGTTTTLVTAYIPMELTSGVTVNFTLATESMACVDPRNFNAKKGRKYGIQKVQNSARNKLWELEGYFLAKTMEHKADV